MKTLAITVASVLAMALAAPAFAGDFQSQSVKDASGKPFKLNVIEQKRVLGSGIYCLTNQVEVDDHMRALACGTFQTETSALATDVIAFGADIDQGMYGFGVLKSANQGIGYNGNSVTVNQSINGSNAVTTR